VFIDATLVRMIIGPALLCIAGDWNWWPGGLKPSYNPNCPPSSPELP
jgi:putative drug exporter of the RND superfamily